MPRSIIAQKCLCQSSVRRSNAHQHLEYLQLKTLLHKAVEEKDCQNLFLIVSRVFVEPMRINDVEHIAKSLHPNVIESVIEKMVHCNAELARLSSTTDTTGYRFARAGAPWEFNRDIMRWCELVTSIVPENEMDENSYVRVCASVFNALYTQRLRTVNDRIIAKHAFARAFGLNMNDIPTASHMKMRKDGYLEIGNAVLRRHTSSTSKSSADAGIACIDEEENFAILEGT